MRPLNKYAWSGRAAILLIVLCCVSTLAWAQQTSGSISGVVKDRQGAVVPNAKVILVNQAQGTVTRELTSGPDGSFVITPLVPAAYTLTVEATGFKKFERKDIRLFANDRIGIGDITLEVGALTETITVEASTVQLQTQSAERSGVITGIQTVNLALNGRNYLSLVGVVPGVVSTFDGQVAGPGGIGNIFANGQRGDQNNVTLDGVTNMDTGSNGTQHTSLNIDAVAEFKVITNSQPADFGRSTGAAINIVTKSGTQNFHGTGYWFHRHEGLNAQTWRNNADNVTTKKKYRYNYQGFNLGGPAYIPGRFNKNKDKLFFFVGREWQNQLIPNTTRYVTVPTAEERQGNFSKTHESDGRAVTITDPTTKQPFPGNIIPQQRWNADGAKILSWYPAPNVSDRPDYNYQSQISASYPRRQLIARIDWNVSEKWRAYFRVIRDKDDQIMPYGQWNADYNIPFGPMHFGQPGLSAIANLTTIINPTLTNEFIFGPSRNRLDITPVDQAFQRSKVNLSYVMPFPNADPLGLVQNWRYGGVPNAPNSSFNGTPFLNVNNTFDFTDNLAKVFTGHQLKVGFYIQRSRKDQTAFTPANGSIDFARDTSNPGNTGWAFSNALLGNFNTLQQSNIIRNGLYRYTNVEWYIADTWKVAPRVTIDVGIRFYIIQPQFDADLQTSSFNPLLWNPSQVAAMYQRRINPATGSAGAYNPVDGKFYPAAYIGGLVSGTGRLIDGAYVNGIGQAGVNGYPRGLMDSRGVHYAPRFGLAYNPEWSTKTVFRLGGGVFYERVQGNPVFDTLPNPPSTLTPTLYYGNLATIASTQGVLYPVSVNSFAKSGEIPTTYNWNLSIQHQLPGQMLLDAGYAGSISRHLAGTWNLNRPGFGTAWLPQNQDPTVTPKYDGSTTLSPNFYRPYPGYGDINLRQFTAISNYNALQLALNRRLAKGLQFGVAYTWSKALGMTGGHGDALAPLNSRMGNYAPLAFDRRQYLVFNYIYDTPKVAKGGNFLDNPVGRAVFNGWTISGVTAMTTGSPTNVGWTISGLSNLAERYTGDPTWGARVVLKGNPQVSGDKRTIYSWLDSSVLAPPAKGSVGLESALRYIYNPGVNNWNVSIFKSFPYTSNEQRFIQVRLEMFNAPNHTQFSGFNNGVTFDQTGKVTNLPTALGGTGGRWGFGTVTGTLDPRIIQIAAKLYF